MIFNFGAENKFRTGYRHVQGVPLHWGLHQIREFRDLRQPKRMLLLISLGHMP